MRRNYLLKLVGLLIADSLAPPFIASRVDIIEIWKILNREKATAYRFWLDSGQTRLMVTAEKPYGGVHNRCWTLEVSKVPKDGLCPNPLRTTPKAFSFDHRPFPGFVRISGSPSERHRVRSVSRILRVATRWSLAPS